MEVEGSLPDRIMGWIDHSPGFNDDYLPEWICVCCRFYVEGPRGKRRARRLPEVLLRLSPISTEYREFRSSMEMAAASEKCSIFELADTTPWPEGEEKID